MLLSTKERGNQIRRGDIPSMRSGSFLGSRFLRLRLPEMLGLRLVSRMSSALVDFEQIQKICSTARLLREHLATRSWHIRTQYIRAMVRGSIDRHWTLDSRRDRSVAVTMLLQLRMRQGLAIIRLRLTILMLQTVLLRGTILSRSAGRGWTWSDACQQSLEIIGSRHFCHAPRWKSDLQSKPQALEFFCKLSFEEQKRRWQ